VRLDALDQALKRCDRVVATFPGDPQPLNERFVIHTLRGEPEKACQDIGAAAKLAARRSDKTLDRLLRNDLRLRIASCRA
jgi:hypothetical protein